jgi:dihydropteroate synthase
MTIRRTWSFRGRRLVLEGGPCLMGVLNVTPDSFHDGGRYDTVECAARRAIEMEREGASIVDVGGESSRPGAAPVDAAEEIRRVVPVLRRIRAGSDVPLSVDTRKPEVADAALAAGADIVNDISGLSNPLMIDVAARHRAGVVVMHMRGEPGTMQQAPAYEDVVGEVRAFLAARVDAAVAGGVPEDAIAVDPGIGFGKTVGHNLALLAALDRLRLRDRPLVVGVSRKSLLGAITGRPVEGRLAASLGALAYLASAGADVVRVHDVAESCDVVRVLHTLKRAGTA